MRKTILSITELQDEVNQLNKLLDDPPGIADEIHVQILPTIEGGYEIDIRLYLETDDDHPWKVNSGDEFDSFQDRESAYEDFLNSIDHYCSYVLNEKASDLSFKLSSKGDTTSVLLTSINYEVFGYEIVGFGDKKYEQADDLMDLKDYNNIQRQNLFETTEELAIIKYGITEEQIYVFVEALDQKYFN